MRAKRKFVGLTVQELAKRVGVTKQTISNIENGKTEFTPVMYRAIGEELGKAFVEMEMTVITNAYIINKEVTD